MGADEKGTKDVSKIFELAIRKVSNAGGGTVVVPKGIFLLKYTVFIPSNIKILGSGKSSVIKANISISEGRCAFLVGDSYEWNAAQSSKYMKASSRGWLANSSFVDVALGDGLKLKTDDKRIKTRNSSIENLLIRFDYSGCGSNWGGYGIQFSHAANCYAKDIWTENATQAIGIGSDTPPSTPGCVEVYAYNITVIKPDPVRTYFSIGMIANSNHCGIYDSRSLLPFTNGSEDGTIIGLNFTEDCTIKNIVGKVGKSTTSEGILLNNAYGTILDNVIISDAKHGIAVTFSDYNLLLKKSLKTNLITNITVRNSDTGILMMSKFNIIKNFVLVDCAVPLKYNINATNNEFYGFTYWLNQLAPNDKKWLEQFNKFIL